MVNKGKQGKTKSRFVEENGKFENIKIKKMGEV